MSLFFSKATVKIDQMLLGNVTYHLEKLFAECCFRLEIISQDTLAKKNKTLTFIARNKCKLLKYFVCILKKNR